MAAWFESSGDIECSMQQVKQALEDLGSYFVDVVRLMPSLTSVELVEQGDDFVVIRTDEGLVRRTNISTEFESERATVEFDEEYRAGPIIATKAHFHDQFTATDAGIAHRTVISDVKTRGLFGFFYRLLGAKSTGNAFLRSHRTYFENQSGDV